MVNWITGNEADEQEDLPWAKDWIKSLNPDSSSIRELISAVIGDKGIFLQTGEFKCFFFKRQDDYRILVETLETLVENQLPVFPLVIKAGKSKCFVGIDDQLPKVVWTKDENKFESRRIDDRPVVTVTKRNPLLEVLITRTDSNSPPEKHPQASESKTLAEASKKGKKAHEPLLG